MAGIAGDLFLKLYLVIFVSGKLAYTKLVCRNVCEYFDDLPILIRTPISIPKFQHGTLYCLLISLVFIIF